MNEKYTNENIEFIRENYPKYGAAYCSKILNKAPHCIYAIVHRYNIPKRNSNREKHPCLMNINIEQFNKISDKNIAYFLGLFWADGNIINYTSNNNEHNRVTLEIVSDDAKDILPIINSIGKWSIRTRQRKHWRQQTVISANNKQIFNFLKDNDYNIKSEESPTKILDRIPEHLTKYFWRGFFDGDGSISYAKHRKMISFCGSYDQNWIDLENLLRKLSIKYSIFRKVESTGNKYSKVLIQNKQGISNIIKYLSPSYDLGLKRKTKKMLEFLNLFT